MKDIGPVKDPMALIIESAAGCKYLDAGGDACSPLSVMLGSLVYGVPVMLLAGSWRR